jgi:hypothetical protein
LNEIPFTLSDTDFLQEGLDFSDISPVEFENLVFHLIDEMGFSNLQWRKGGEGNSANDGGRDLEATYWNVQPAGATEDKYWFEVKCRKNTLEKQQVQSTVLNATSGNTKNLVIVTNSNVSNPTLDWVREHQIKHPLPKVTVWQGHDLEILLRKNPRTLSRFLPSSLSFSGRCKVIESKFTNLLILPSGDELAELWERRGLFSENSFLLLAACISEVVYGDISERPWGMDLEANAILAVAATAAINIYPFVFKCSSLNREQAPLIEGMAYIFQCMLLRYGAQTTARVLANPEALFESDYELPFDLQKNRYEPILNVIYHDLAIHCSSKYCMKLHHLDPKTEPEYFLRFKEPAQKEKDDRYLVMNSIKDECKLGLVQREEYCPLGDTELQTQSIEQLHEKLDFARSVIVARVSELEENA